MYVSKVSRHNIDFKSKTFGVEQTTQANYVDKLV